MSAVPAEARRPICPSCGEAGQIYEVDSVPRRRDVLLIADDGIVDYGEARYLDGGECSMHCHACAAETTFDECLEATFPDDEAPTC